MCFVRLESLHVLTIFADMNEISNFCSGVCSDDVVRVVIDILCSTNSYLESDI